MRLGPASQGCSSVQRGPAGKRCAACKPLRAVPEAQRNIIQPIIPTLQTVEVAAITVAAGTQAVLLLQPALAALQRAPQQATQPQQQQLGAEQQGQPIASSPAAPIVVNSTGTTSASEVVVDHMPAHLSASPSTAAGGFNSMGHAGLQQLQACAILVALMAGAALRHLSSVTRAVSDHHQKQQQQLSAQGAARLVALEAAAAAQAGDMAASSKQLAKLSARVQVATSDLKVPLRQLQQAAGQQAAALAALAEAQGGMDTRLDGVEQVLGALQEVQAKQFKVTAQVLQQAQQQQRQQQGAGRSRASSPSELTSLQRQQQQLEAAVKAQQQHLLKLEVLLQQARAAASSNGLPATDSATGPTSGSNGSTGAGAASADGASSTAADDNVQNGSSSSSNGSSGVVPPDPWQRPLPMAAAGLTVPDAGPAMRRR